MCIRHSMFKGRNPFISNTRLFHIYRTQGQQISPLFEGFFHTFCSSKRNCSVFLAFLHLNDEPHSFLCEPWTHLPAICVANITWMRKHGCIVCLSEKETSHPTLGDSLT